jgi:hypothetical protein
MLVKKRIPHPSIKSVEIPTTGTQSLETTVALLGLTDHPLRFVRIRRALRRW